MSKFRILLVTALLPFALCAPVAAQDRAKPEQKRVLVLKTEADGIQLQIALEPKHSVEITTGKAVRNSDWLTRPRNFGADDTIATYGPATIVLKREQRTVMTLKSESATTLTLPWAQLPSAHVQFTAEKTDEGRGATVFTGAVRITIRPKDK